MSAHVGMNTPWGRADHVLEFAPGFYEIGTPGHGGMLVQSPWKLSPQAKALATSNRGGFWYEEDDLWAVPLHDNPALFDLVAANRAARGYSVEKLREDVRATLERYHPEFLAGARLLPPEPKTPKLKPLAEGDRLTWVAEGWSLPSSICGGKEVPITPGTGVVVTAVVGGSVHLRVGWATIRLSKIQTRKVTTPAPKEN